LGSHCFGGNPVSNEICFKVTLFLDTLLLVILFKEQLTILGTPCFWTFFFWTTFLGTTCLGKPWFRDNLFGDTLVWVWPAFGHPVWVDTTHPRFEWSLQCQKYAKPGPPKNVRLHFFFFSSGRPPSQEDRLPLTFGGFAMHPKSELVLTFPVFIFFGSSHLFVLLLEEKKMGKKTFLLGLQLLRACPLRYASQGQDQKKIDSLDEGEDDDGGEVRRTGKKSYPVFLSSC
jgi:hypothetical protein